MPGDRSLRVTPWPAFNFRVEIVRDDGSTPLARAAFSECDGLEMTQEVKTLREGGNPLRVHRLAGGHQPTAQAVALANAFVALVSPRAFRGPKSFAETETLLLGEIDRRFSKQAVLGLLNFRNNHGGRDIWVARTSPTSI